MADRKFNPNQFESIYPDGIENHYWNHARNNIIYSCLKHTGLTGAQILEIGAGRGVVTKFLHDKGIDITGVELADVRPLPGTGTYFQRRTDAFELSHEIRKNISVVLLLDVLEHIEYPSVFLDEITGHFPKLEYILITVPARQELWTNYDEYNGHYRRYSFKETDDLNTDKLTCFFSAYFFHILYPVFCVYSKWIRKRETYIKAPDGIQLIFHRFLSFLLRLDFSIIPRHFRGTSIIAIYRMSHDQRN